MRYLCVLLLAGCASPGHYAWERIDGASPTAQWLYMDKGQCEAMAVGATGNENRQVEVFVACMRGKGWRFVQR
jgi:hypothetical protein